MALDSEVLRPVPARSAWVEAGLRTLSSPWTWLSGVLLAAALLVLGHASAEAAGGDQPGLVPPAIAATGHVSVAAPVPTRASSTVTRIVTSSPSLRYTATAVTGTLATVTRPLPAPLGSAVQGVAGGLLRMPATAASLPVLTAPTGPVAAAPPLAPVAAVPLPATQHAGARARTLRGPFAAAARADSPAAPRSPGRLPVPLPGAPGGLASIAGASAGAFSPPATAPLTPLLVLIALLAARPVGRALRPSMHASRIRRPG